jgi:hypothetical protein
MRRATLRLHLPPRAAGFHWRETPAQVATVTLLSAVSARMRRFDY